MYKKTIATLLKNSEFGEAEYIRTLCSKLEKEDLEKAKDVKENKIKSAISQLARKHIHDLNVLKSKMNSGLANLSRLKDKEYDK